MKTRPDTNQASKEIKAIASIFYGGEVPGIPSDSIVWRMAKDLAQLKRENEKIGGRKYAEELQQIAEAVGMPFASGARVVARVRELVVLANCGKPISLQQQKAAASRWNSMTKEERSAEMSRIRKKGIKNKKARKRQPRKHNITITDRDQPHKLQNDCDNTRNERTTERRRW